MIRVVSSGASEDLRPPEEHDANPDILDPAPIRWLFLETTPFSIFAKENVGNTLDPLSLFPSGSIRVD